MNNTFSEYVGLFDNPLDAAFDNVRRDVLKTMHATNGQVSFKLPQDYMRYFGHILPLPAMPLAAHTQHPGKLVEGVGQENKHGKGGLIFKGVQDRLPPWPENEAQQFQKNLKRYIQRIGKEIGLLFEIKVFKTLVKGFRLKPIEGTDEYEIDTQERQILKSMSDKTHNKSFIVKLEALVKVHALDMARDIMNASRRIMPYCNIDQVIFQGGQGSNTGVFLNARSDPADIVVVCSKIRPSRLTTNNEDQLAETKLYTWMKDLYAKGRNKTTNQREFYLQALNELLEEKRNSPEQSKEEDEVPF